MPASPPLRPTFGDVAIGVASLFGLLLALLALLPLPASAEETIRSFDTEIVVETDGAVAIAETIEVNVEGIRIRRGIFRDIPVGSSGRAGFDVIEVLRNGAAEPYAIESISDGVRIRIGDADVMLPHAPQVYTIRYRMADQVGYSRDYDEIYWNATGNLWEFPIERARATVILPRDARVVSSAAYTGPEGSTGSDVRIVREDDRTVHFTATRRLAAYEGMTVAVAFPKGLVAEPAWTDRVLRGVYGQSMLIGIGGLALVLFYYLVAWARVGRDPPGGPVVARWESELPPAAMRFLDRMKFDSMTFTTAIVSMAAKGWLTIEESDKEYTLYRRDLPENLREKLSPGEAKVWKLVFAPGVKSFVVKQANRSVLQKAQAALKLHFETTYDRKFFHRNRRWFVPGIVLTVIVWLVVAWKSAQPDVAMFMTLWLSGWTFGCVFLVWKVVLLWRDVLSGQSWKSLPAAIIMSVFSLPFLGGWLFGAGAQVQAVGYAGLAILVLAVVLNVLFFRLLEARTPLGQTLADEIDGMRRYLTVAEKDRLAFHHPPERTPEHFERLLPYAIALGVEEEWAKQFDDVFARLTAENRQAYRPNWYRGDRFRPGSMGGLGGGLGSSLAAASASPSSGGRTGGSFGGGSSGGGGGGGGGGGW